MAVADGNGLPIAVGIASGQLAECRLVRSVLSARFLQEVPERLIGDKAYDSNQLDAELLADYGIEMIAPHNPTHRKTQDGRPLRRYRRRWKIERLFSWLMRFRRLVTRYERKAENFLGLVQLACAIVLLRVTTS
jgi:transposase